MCPPTATTRPTPCGSAAEGCNLQYSEILPARSREDLLSVGGFDPTAVRRPDSGRTQCECTAARAVQPLAGHPRLISVHAVNSEPLPDHGSSTGGSPPDGSRGPARTRCATRSPCRTAPGSTATISSVVRRHGVSPPISSRIARRGADASQIETGGDPMYAVTAADGERILHAAMTALPARCCPVGHPSFSTISTCGASWPASRRRPRCPATPRSTSGRRAGRPSHGPGSGPADGRFVGLPIGVEEPTRHTGRQQDPGGGKISRGIASAHLAEIEPIDGAEHHFVRGFVGLPARAL